MEPLNIAMSSADSRKIYQIVQFVTPVRKFFTFIPTSWIKANGEDTENYNFVSKFLLPPDEQLTNLIKSREDPPENWPGYKVNVIRGVDSYDEATEQVKIIRERRLNYLMKRRSGISDMDYMIGRLRKRKLEQQQDDEFLVNEVASKLAKVSV